MTDKTIKALLVEDNPADAFLVAEMLKSARGVSFVLEKADRVSLAMEALYRGPFDVILLDLSLPDSMGLESFTKIHHSFNYLPIIVFTGLHDEELALKAVQEGAQDYIVKGGIESDLLVMAIRYSIERKRLEERLIKSEKMEAIGHLAGGLAHDFGNILMLIKLNAQMLQEDLKQNGYSNPAVEKILSSTEKAISIIRGLHALSRKQTMHPEVVDLNQTIRKFEKFILMLIGKTNIVLSLKLSAKKMYIMADSTQLEQVLMNLTINAKDAMPDGGSLTIGTDSLESPDGLIDGETFLGPGKLAVISVTDTGHGIDSKVLDRIFEPFFTTKEEGKGTGLGLSTVYGIVKQHNGAVHCQSSQGAGTTFKIYLPIVESGG